MIFYDCATAPSPRRARIFIAQKGLQIETREISIAKGAHLLPDFLAINPRATVPVLITETGQTLTENIAIATYLEALHPNPPLLGTSPDEKAAVMMWNAIAEQQGGLPIAEVLRNSNPHMQGRAVTGPTNFDQIPELASRGHARVVLFFDLLERRLAQVPYLAGDFYSMADITAFVFIQFARVIKTAIPPGNTATLEWYEQMKSRPGATL